MGKIYYIWLKSVILEIAYKKHKDWLRICRSFNCGDDDCKDIVSEMYLKIDDLTKKGTDLYYGENDINYFYVYKMIFHACLRLKQQHNKRQSLISTFNTESFNLGGALAKYNIKTNMEDQVYLGRLDAFTDSYEKKLVWYDVAIFELITNGKKISELSRETNISYVSLRNTYLKVREFIKEEYEKYDWTMGEEN